ncbi:hypothetical protein QTP88_003711 [Uroleucon formosanum]
MVCISIERQLARTSRHLITGFRPLLLNAQYGVKCSESNDSASRSFQFFPKRVSHRNVSLLFTPQTAEPIEIEQIFIAYDLGDIFYGITFDFGHTASRSHAINKCRIGLTESPKFCIRLAPYGGGDGAS